MMIGKKVTIKDVAREANVSITTVSLILNNRKCNISASTIKKVKDICAQIGYEPNMIASSLVTKVTKTIGYIIPDIQNMYFSEIAKKLETSLAKAGYSLFLANSDDSFEKELKIIKNLAMRNVDLLVIVPSMEAVKEENSNQLKQALSTLSIPSIIIDRVINDFNGSIIASDNVYGGYLATKHLIECGHRDIAIICGPKDVSSAKNRYLGYVKALEEAKIPLKDEYVFYGDYQFETGAEVANKILKLKNVSAIFACNDMMAYGCIKTIKKGGFKIPEDYSIVGYDDLIFSEILDIPLTSIRQDTDTLVCALNDYILDTLENKNETCLRKEIIPTLSNRASVLRKGGEA